MKLYVKTIFIVLLPFCANSQSIERQVVASSGNFVQNIEGSLSFTVGESTIQLGADGVNILTQGFQQPFTSPIIPVEFGDFSAQKQDKSVKLNWFTYSERNSLRFDIERSDDAKSFSKIAEIKAIGISAVRHDYEVFDKSPLEGVNYYRMRQIDFDGRETFYKTVAIYFDSPNKKQNWARVFPSFAKEEAIISCQFINDAHLTVTNIFGIPVRQWAIPKTENPYQQSFLMGDLPNGTYLFIFKTVDTQVVQKVIKQ